MIVITYLLKVNLLKSTKYNTKQDEKQALIYKRKKLCINESSQN